MPYNLWILPLLSGYYLIKHYIYFKYKFQRLDSQSLLFYSIIYGIIIFVSSYILRVGINFIFPSIIPSLHNLLYQLPIKKQDFLWTSLFTFLSTLVSVKLLNKILHTFNYFDWKRPVEKAVDNFGDEIEKLFKQSFTDQLLIQITLKNNKVYVGFTDKIPPPKETNYLKIIPVLSGYRESESKKLIFTTEYLEALAYYNENPEKFESFEMDVIIKQDEILTAGIFDQEIYEKFKPSTAPS